MRCAPAVYFFEGFFAVLVAVLALVWVVGSL